MMKTVHTVDCEQVRVVVKFNEEFDEYVCRISVNGKREKAADYFTDDEGDAISTAKTMAMHRYARLQPQSA